MPARTGCEDQGLAFDVAGRGVTLLLTLVGKAIGRRELATRPRLDERPARGRRDEALDLRQERRYGAGARISRHGERLGPSQREDRAVATGEQ